MYKDQGLYEYISARTGDITEQWYESLDKNKQGVYGTRDPQQIELLKKQNHDFHVHFSLIFIKDSDIFFKEFQEWIEDTAKDEAHLATPIVEVIEEFFRTQQQYLDIIGEYAVKNREKISFERLNKWNAAVIDTISKVILEFTSANSRISQQRLQAQQQIIVEMSAPVILLTQKFGLLPLIGEITPHRAQIIFEKTLKQCAKDNIEKLFIDLSGVPVIDTMVAQQIFQLIQGLNIIGVKTALSGISPVIAQTAVQLGIKFVDIEVYNKLAQAFQQNKSIFS